MTGASVDIDGFFQPASLELEYEQEPDGRWLAVVEQIPGVMAYGDTKETAAIRVRRLLADVLAEERARSSEKRAERFPISV